jgi:hypothetical protein
LVRIDDVLKQAGDVSGKVIVTCSLPMDEGSTITNIERVVDDATEVDAPGVPGHSWP